MVYIKKEFLFTKILIVLLILILGCIQLSQAQIRPKEGQPIIIFIMNLKLDFTYVI